MIFLRENNHSHLHAAVLFYRARTQLAFYFRKLDGNDFGYTLFLHGDAKQGIGLVHRRFSVRDDDKLGVLREVL